MSTHLCLLSVLLNAAVTATVLQCNHSLESGSVLQLTEKLDLSGKDPDPIDDPWPCAIVGPPKSPPATIFVPDTDCVLLAQGNITISGNVRFVVGKKQRDFDCCRDGEGHGSILCSYSNLTFAAGAVVTVETTDAAVVINPGGFWTGKYITVHGSINASLQKGQMTGINGLLSSSGVRISASGRVIAAGQVMARGAAIQGGEYGTIIDGTVECSTYNASDAGGCIAGGKYLSLGLSGTIRASNGFGNAAGCVMSSDDMSKFPLQGRVVADSIRCLDAGAVIAAQHVTMIGNASIDARNLYAEGGSAVVACGNLTLRDNARIAVNNSWGGDGGAIGVSFARLQDNAVLSCENSYADSCGGCLLASIELIGKASVIARNVSSKALGGALCGGYPGQDLSVRGEVTIDVFGSTTGMYGGAIMAHNINFGGGAFKVELKNAEADCGAGIATLDQDQRWGQGFLTVDAASGGVVLIEDARERNPSLACSNILAHVSPPIDQACSACSSPDFPPAQRDGCTCRLQKPAAVRECCSFP